MAVSKTTSQKIFLSGIQKPKINYTQGQQRFKGFKCKGRFCGIQKVVKGRISLYILSDKCCSNVCQILDSVLPGPALEGVWKRLHELETDNDFIFTVASCKRLVKLSLCSQLHMTLRLSQHHTMVSRTHQYTERKETATNSLMPQVA